MDLKFRLGGDVGPEHYKHLAAILNPAWGSQIIATPEMMGERLTSGSDFFFAYDNASYKDIERFFSRPNLYLFEEGIFVEENERIPVGFLETIAIKTGGSYQNFSKNYDELTDFGHWKAPEEDADTLIMVDVTVLPTRQGEKGDGEAKKLIKYVQHYVARETDFKYIWTFTPDIRSVKEWHKGLGANYTEHIIPNARPNFSASDVNSMDYSDEINFLRFLLSLWK